MLWKDFAAKENCTDCPVLDSGICPGGWSCYGGQPIEPPCCSFDDDTDIDEWINKYFEYQEERIKELRLENKKKERAKKAAETRRAIRSYCWKEIYELKRAEKELSKQKAIEYFASSLAEAINITNGMFQYPERVEVKLEISDDVKTLEENVERAKEAYNLKRKEFYLKRKSESNRSNDDK